MKFYCVSKTGEKIINHRQVEVTAFLCAAIARFNETGVSKDVKELKAEIIEITYDYFFLSVSALPGQHQKINVFTKGVDAMLVLEIIGI